jgi:hypothetical protein
VPKRNNNADLFNDAARGSQGSNKEYSGFGILGKSKQQQQYPTFGNKRNSAGAGSGGAVEEDDLLDDILDNMEEKKGIETTKPKSAKDNSFGSQQAAPSQGTGGFQRLPSAKSQVVNDAWNREHLDDLEDLGGNPVDDARSKKSGAS